LNPATTFPPTRFRSEGAVEAALDFARLGLQTLPVHFIMTGSEVVCSCGARDCDSVGKHPIAELVPHGFETASSNPRVIAHWFKRYPQANVGMVVGLVCVFDVDPRHRGDETLRRLERAHGHLPTTWRATTGGGGEHVFFAAPEGGIASGRLGQGIDFKGSRGYVVAASSLHVSDASHRIFRIEDLDRVIYDLKNARFGHHCPRNAERAVREIDVLSAVMCG
jgi:hypothetical protein